MHGMQHSAANIPARSFSLIAAGDGFLRQSSPAAPAAEERLLPPHLCALVKQLASRMEQQLPAAIAARVGICD